jgi:hypothetical protein
VTDTTRKPVCSWCGASGNLAVANRDAGNAVHERDARISDLEESVAIAHRDRDRLLDERDRTMAEVRKADRERIAVLESELLESSEQHGVYRDRAQQLADRVLEDELRIASLRSGLREACDVLDDAGGCGGTIMKLRALADGVQPSKETT